MVQSLQEKKDKADVAKQLKRREAARWARIKRVYGLTKEQYEELDYGHCVICLRDWSQSVRPCIDHDHSSGEIRGLLCSYCNHRVVGRHRDWTLLQRVADYLKSPRKGWVVPPKKRKTRKKNGRTKR